jgi:hypothetical protein
VPKAHYLEAWADGLTWDGTWTLAQPLILPLYGGMSTIELPRPPARRRQDRRRP